MANLFIRKVFNNNRPISLLTICGKILEKIIFNHLYSFLNVNNIINKKQSGFRPGNSITNQLLDFVDTIYQSFDVTPWIYIKPLKRFDTNSRQSIIMTFWDETMQLCRNFLFRHIIDKEYK